MSYLADTVPYCQLWLHPVSVWKRQGQGWNRQWEREDRTGQRDRMPSIVTRHSRLTGDKWAMIVIKGIHPVHSFMDVQTPIKTQYIFWSPKPLSISLFHSIYGSHFSVSVCPLSLVGCSISILMRPDWSFSHKTVLGWVSVWEWLRHQSGFMVHHSRELRF